MKFDKFARQLALVAVASAALSAAAVKIPNCGDMLQQIQDKQGEVAKIQEEITAAGKEAALAPDEKGRNAAWKKVEAGEKKFFKFLDGDFAGVKLDAANKKIMKEKYYARAVESIKQAEEQVQDPAAKKFLEKKRKNYEKKLPKPKKEKAEKAK